MDTTVESLSVCLSTRAVPKGQPSADEDTCTSAVAAVYKLLGVAFHRQSPKGPDRNEIVPAHETVFGSGHFALNKW